MQRCTCCGNERPVRTFVCIWPAHLGLTFPRPLGVDGPHVGDPGTGRTVERFCRRCEAVWGLSLESTLGCQLRPTPEPLLQLVR